MRATPSWLTWKPLARISAQATYGLREAYRRQTRLDAGPEGRQFGLSAYRDTDIRHLGRNENAIA